MMQQEMRIIPCTRPEYSRRIECRKSERDFVAGLKDAGCDAMPETDELHCR